MKTAARLAQLYRRVPAIACQGKCAASCGPIVVARAEAHAMVKAGGPFTIEAELTCGYLEAGRCRIYEVRPLICRIWGTDRKLTCPFGCQPARFLGNGEGADLLLALRRIGGRWVAPGSWPGGPRFTGPSAEDDAALAGQTLRGPE